MSDRVLRTRDLNRALLARQLLLERSAIPPSQALERLAGLQTQYAPSAYIGLWSRLRDFRRDALTEALVQRSAVQATLMRSTIHTVSAEDFPLFASGLRDGRREWWLRVQRHQVEAPDMEVVAGLLQEHLARGPCRDNDLKDLLSARHATEASGLERLVRRYLGGFGPAPLNDMANWTGLPVSRVLPAVQRLG